jgi:type 1 glutamine amidotransferase
MNRRQFIATSALAAGASFLRAQDVAKPDIWGRTVGAQPFDRAPFREIKVPEWVRNTLGVGYTLSGMNTEKRARAAAAGVTISELGFVDPFYAYYDSKLLLRRSPHVPLERITREVAEYQRLGVRILGVYPPTLQSEAYELHPDWRLISKDTREIPSVDLKQAPHGGMLCPLGPYGDFFIAVLAEILTLFPAVDAFSFDGLHYGGACYCQHCRANYKADTGDELPPRDIANPAFRRYQHWADRRMESLIQRMQTRLKGLKPEVALVTWTTNAGRFGHFLDVPRNMPARMNLLLDAPDMEFWLDETNRGASIVPAFGCAYMWAVTNHRVAFAEPYLMSRGNPYGKDSFPAHEIERRMLLALTHGPVPSLAVGQPVHLQEAAYHCLGEVKKRAAWVTHKSPEPWCALVMSDNTRCFYPRGSVEERYLANVFGVFRAGIEAHLPVALINDWNLTPGDLAPYKVLVLANTACLDDAQAAAIRSFVENGGGLVATLDAGLCDEFGNAREKHALADVLGIDHLGPAIADAPPAELDVNFARTLPPEYWNKRKGVWDFAYTRGTFLDALWPLLGEGRVTFKGPAIRVKPRENAKTVAMLHPRSGSKGEPVPAVVTNTFGKGRVVTFAAGMDAANYLTPYPYYREALRSAIEHAASAPAPVRVTAPMCVHAVTTRQEKDGRRLVVHLYNDVNTTAFHGMPADDVPLREEVLPIHGIRVEFRGYAIRNVHLEPGNTPLPLEQDGPLTRVTVPKLDIHAMVVAEL